MKADAKSDCASPHDPFFGLDKDVALYSDVKNESMRNRFAEITAMDRAIGTMQQTLRDLNVTDNTLVWFNSDNGISVKSESDSFNGGWRGKKGDIYEGGMLVPAIVQWPSVIRQPRQSRVPCVTSDILPTVLDLVGLAYPDSDRPLDGISLKSLIVDGAMTERPSPIGFWKYVSGGESKNERWVPEELSRGTTPTTRNPGIDFLNFRHPVAKEADFAGQAAWTDNRYKLVVAGGASKKAKASSNASLYDLISDPTETTDVAEAHPEIVERMTAQLHA